jgi:hypothetical protein
MALVQLTARDREALERAARHSSDARETRRALALLDLADGQKPGQVAARYRVRLFQMEPTERLRLAGVLSGNFWLPT